MSMRFDAIPDMRSARAVARPFEAATVGAGSRGSRPGAMGGARRRLRSLVLSLAGLALVFFNLSPAWASGFAMVCPALRGDKLNHQHACEAEDRSPPLQFAGIPAKAKSMAVLMIDQGASRGDSTLWIIYNLPAKTMVLPENQPHVRDIKGLGMQLQNVDGKFGYKGPCPTTGSTRRFVIEAFVLDTQLELPETADRRDFLLAVEGHILARTKVNGRYKK